jgi:hypothetical protein
LTDAAAAALRAAQEVDGRIGLLEAKYARLREALERA